MINLGILSVKDVLELNNIDFTYGHKRCVIRGIEDTIPYCKIEYTTYPQINPFLFFQIILKLTTLTNQEFTNLFPMYKLSISQINEYREIGYIFSNWFGENLVHEIILSPTGD